MSDSSILERLFEPDKLTIPLPNCSLPEWLREGSPEGVLLVRWRYGDPGGPRIWLFEPEITFFRSDPLTAKNFLPKVEDLLVLAMVLTLEDAPGIPKMKKEQKSSLTRMFLVFQTRSWLQSYMGLTTGRAAAYDIGVLPTDPAERERADHNAIVGSALYEEARRRAEEDLETEECFDAVIGSIVGPPMPKGGDPGPPISLREIRQALDHPFVPRLLAWLEKHNEDPLEHYNRRRKKLISDGFKDLAKQKKDPMTGEAWAGGDLDPRECRRVYACLIVYSFYYMADCWDRLCGYVLNWLEAEAPLSDRERDLFIQMHMPSPYLANLPTMVLLERLPLLRNVLADIWEKLARGEKDAMKAVAPLLRLYRAVIAHRRDKERSRKREAAATSVYSLDREAKSRGDGRPLTDYDSVPAPPEYDLDLLLNNAAVGVVEGEPCPRCGSRSWDCTGYNLFGTALPDADTSIEFRYRCRGCDKELTKNLRYEDMKRLLTGED